MGKSALSGRENWQTESGPGGLAGTAEKDLYSAFEKAFEGTIYKISDHPNDLKHLYEHVNLPKQTLSQIYCPNEATMLNAQKRGWGVSPDFSITNTKTGKILFGEIKRQDGWVEGKDPSAGRGNAHERMCKLFTPGLIKTYRNISGIEDEEILPFWVVLEGDITRDPKRNREISFWFDTYDKNYFMWRPNMTEQDLVDHFNMYLKPYLD
ncbi:MunI family type II restriction endonuclease [Lacrimispora saccharolytica]|uniref:Type II site-specific deoxyribonuclease n=1 Tax=Lacrimispora saccharolytica (strain ATCC 35040 / DSM 2544 / NRCC 2533 / WM1) TaxID=610130 RepID=D9R839_LACSW|nr:MunI family type II restriction endonuclease [Lacrimispora saccharolytica]ADL03791.1 Type II site-specific deoxyribonuclease [[Clostridium] saccharolyticum WM1]QRV21891.1 MunI family type II restriction endonuclease [Lacrimispora saccharolytica]